MDDNALGLLLLKQRRLTAKINSLKTRIADMAKSLTEFAQMLEVDVEKPYFKNVTEGVNVHAPRTAKAQSRKADAYNGTEWARVDMVLLAGALKEMHEAMDELEKVESAIPEIK